MLTRVRLVFLLGAVTCMVAMAGSGVGVTNARPQNSQESFKEKATRVRAELRKKKAEDAAYYDSCHDCAYDAAGEGSDVYEQCKDEGGSFDYCNELGNAAACRYAISNCSPCGMVIEMLCNPD